MPSNRKVSALSDAAFRLYVTASCWSVEEETDGVIPAHVPMTLPRAPRGKALLKAIAELVDNGVWETRDDGEHIIHDHLVYNPSAAQSKALRETKAAAGAAGGRAKASSHHGKTLAAARRQLEQTPGTELAESKQNSSPRAGAGARSDSDSDSDSDSHTPSSDLSDQPDPGRETLCPADLVAKAEALGVFTELAEKLAVPIESLRHEAADFVGYWTFGAGGGARRTGWMRQLRERLRKRHREGQLKPVGAIEHEAVKRREGSREGPAAPPPRLPYFRDDDSVDRMSPTTLGESVAAFLGKRAGA